MNSALALGAAIERGQCDPRDLAAELIDRIDAQDPRHEIYVRTTRERAMAEAEAARDRSRSGLRRSPLDGVPLSWKDVFDTADIPTEGGSPLLKGRVPKRDAELVRRMTLAGAVCLGKTNMTELAFSGLGINPMTGTPANPADPAIARCPGGSSSGAAVSVATGLAAAAIGSDTGGSIRLPAAWNGLVGFKPTYGLLPLEGVLPLAESFDTAGPIARDVADAAALFAALLQARPVDLEGLELRSAVFWLAGNPADQDLEAEVDRLFGAAIERLSGICERIDFKPWSSAKDALDLSPPLIGGEAYAAWGPMIEHQPELVSAPIRHRFLGAKDVRASTVLEGFKRLRATRDRHDAEAAGYDAILLPTAAITPPEIAPLLADSAEFGRVNLLALRNTRIVNLLGLPAITLPIGRCRKGLPVGLSLVGKPRGEGQLLRLAKAVETLLLD